MQRWPKTFAGDLVYSQMHAFLGDGFYNEWLANLARAKRALPADTMLFMGHGQPAMGHELLDWQESYIQRVVGVLKRLQSTRAWKVMRSRTQWPRV